MEFSLGIHARSLATRSVRGGQQPKPRQIQTNNKKCTQSTPSCRSWKVE